MTSTNSTPIVNSAHGPGLTSLCFAPDGWHAYTGGADTLVRIWNIPEGASHDPPLAVEATEPITSLVATNDCWLSASEDGEVRRYPAGQGEMSGMVTTVVGTAVRSLAVDPKGTKVAVGSDELSVKIIDLEDTTNVIVLAGHTKGVRRITWHPAGTFITVSGADGSVTVWDVRKDEPKLLEIIRGLIPAVHDPISEDFSYDCSAVWHPSGDHFFVATRAHDIAVVSSSDWTKSSTLSDASQLGAITALGLSANGVYLATATQAGVVIWSTQNRRVLIQLPYAGPSFATQIAWSPTQNLLAWTDREGWLVRHHDVVPKTFADPVKAPGGFATMKSLKRTDASVLDDLLAGENDNGPGNDDDVDLNGDDDGMHDFLEDDIGEYLKEDGGEAQFRSGQVEVVNITKAQSAFQPGATPMDASKRKRLLAYNMLGYIEVTDQDTHHVVDVKMHDQSSDAARKGYHFTDNFKYDMAVLSERGTAFACQPEEGHRAHVAFKPYASWDTGSRASEDEWTYELPPGVKVLGLAAGGAPLPAGKRAWARDIEGRGHVVIATSEHELTFMTGTGIERHSMGLDGDFVAMVAGPEWVFVVHRDGATTIDGSQNLKGTLITLDDFCVLQERRLPIPKNHTLKWIGITEEGAPAIYDSTGVLQIMPRFRIPLRGTWARVLNSNKLDRREGKDESYWPFAVTGDTFRCLVLKGRQEYPPFPIPYPSELEMRLPFRKTDADEAPLEEVFARKSMFLDISRDALGDELTTEDISKQEAALDMELIKLLGKACSSNLERPTRQARALDLARLIHNPAIFESAIKVAQFYKLRGLEDRIGRVKSMREDEDRLRTARDRRRDWAGDVAAVPAPTRPTYGATTTGVKAFDDFEPPAAIARPGLARVKPAAPAASSSSWASTSEDAFGSESAPDAEGKRKRTPDDEPPAADPKRRAFGAVPAQKANPFARKPATGHGVDPFSRDQGKKTVRKSDSFFSKVEAAETGGATRPSGKGKAREVGRQTTLFGHAVRTGDAPKITAPIVKSSKPVVASTLSGSPLPEPEDDAQLDTEEETQLLDDGEITPEIVSGATTVPADEEDEEPMEWPDSPGPAEPASLAAE